MYPGVVEYTKRNNIYDLAGNCSEWTTENPGTITSFAAVVVRGGSYSYHGYDRPASDRSGDVASGSGYNSFRPALYINAN